MRRKNYLFKIKYLFLLLLIGSTHSFSQSRSILKSINDDDETLVLCYSVISGNRNINYENTFYIKGWSKIQKNALVGRIIDSLNSAPSNQNKTTASNKSVKITDGGNVLTVKVDSVTKDHEILHSRSYDVKGKSKKENENMVKNVIKQLDLKDAE